MNLASIAASLAAILAVLNGMQHGTTTPQPPVVMNVATTTESTSLLIVGTSTYRIQGHGTLIQAMRELASTTSFRYTSREYPGLGSFVESINGIRPSAGYYWILYKAGKKSSVGASSITLRSGDIVEWKYEKGY
jgi:hypothetical protein